MILHPGVLALLAISLAGGGLVAYAARWAVAILRRWDLASGARLQLELERRTYLVSTLVGWALAFQAVSVFLFVYTADALAPLFTGAMCAAGTLNAHPLGYPVLALKLVTSVAAGLWLALDHADALGFDYPLVRPKYTALLALAPLVLAEGALQAAFFAALEPEVITSCCGSLFGKGGAGVGSDLAGLPHGAAGAAFFAVTGAALAAGLAFRATGRATAGYALAALSAAALPVGLAAVIAFLSPYVYELPTHHCPFCLLQREYGHVGYAVYAALLGGGVAGMAVGVVMPFRARPSLAAAAPPYLRALATAASALLAALLGIAAWAVLTSALRR